MSAALQDPAARGPDGLALIFWLVKIGRGDLVETHLAAGAPLEAQGYHGATPLLTAALAGHWTIAALLAARGARLEAIDGRGFSLAWLAGLARPPKGPEAEALERLRQALNARGLFEEVLDPKAQRRRAAARVSAS